MIGDAFVIGLWAGLMFVGVFASALNRASIAGLWKGAMKNLDGILRHFRQASRQPEHEKP